MTEQTGDVGRIPGCNALEHKAQHFSCSSSDPTNAALAPMRYALECTAAAAPPRPTW